MTRHEIIGALVAWTEQRKDGRVTASMIGAMIDHTGTPREADRQPAVIECCSEDAALSVIRAEAAAIGVPIHWKAAA
jgi:hypothetical protein